MPNSDYWRCYRMITTAMTRRIELAARLLLLGYGLLIATLSLLPSDSAPQVDVWDKAQHFAAYAVFMLLTGPYRQTQQLLWRGLGILCFSGAIEVGQAFSPGRFASMADLLANGLGIAIGAIVLAILYGRGNRTGW